MGRQTRAVERRRGHASCSLVRFACWEDNEQIRTKWEGASRLWFWTQWAFRFSDGMKSRIDDSERVQREKTKLWGEVTVAERSQLVELVKLIWPEESHQADFVSCLLIFMNPDVIVWQSLSRRCWKKNLISLGVEHVVVLIFRPKQLRLELQDETIRSSRFWPVRLL